MYCNYILQLCSKKLFGHWPYSVYLYICTWPLAINFADMPIHILSLSLSFVNLHLGNTSAGFLMSASLIKVMSLLAIRSVRDFITSKTDTGIMFVQIQRRR